MAGRDPEPRMLTQAQAANYCGIGVKAFKTICPVESTQLSNGLSRYDRYRLDTWLDSIAPNSAKTNAEIDWLERLRETRASG